MSFDRLRAWWTGRRITLVDRIAIFIVFSILLLGCLNGVREFCRHYANLQRLQRSGQDTIAQVEESLLSDRSKIIYDGHTALLDRELPSDARPAVTYLPTEPRVFALGHAGDSMSALYRANIGSRGTGQFLFCIVVAVVSVPCVIAAFTPQRKVDPAQRNI